MMSSANSWWMTCSGRSGTCIEQIARDQVHCPVAHHGNNALTRRLSLQFEFVDFFQSDSYKTIVEH